MSTRQARRRQQRAPQQRRSPSKRRRSTPPWYRSPTGLGIAVVAVAVIVILIAVASQNSTSRQAAFASTSPSPTVLAAVTKPSPALGAVGDGGLVSPWQAIIKPPKDRLTLVGKPELFFWGGEFCPICAADRWSLINALSRFGHISGIYTMKSSSSDIYPNTNTFTFRHATYTSKYLSFVPEEAEDRNQNSLPVSPAAQALVNKYDQPPYVAKGYGGGFPFLDLANRAVGNLPANENEGYLHTDPSQTQSGIYSSPLSWQTIAADLASPATPQAKIIFGNANWLTAGICKETKNRPASVCAARPIPQLESQLTFK